LEGAKAPLVGEPMKFVRAERSVVVTKLVKIEVCVERKCNGPEHFCPP